MVIYDMEFKQRVCRLVRAGKPVAQVSQDLGLNESTVYRWLKWYEDFTQVALAKKHPRRKSKQRHSEKIADLKEENMILKKRIAILRKYLK